MADQQISEAAVAFEEDEDEFRSCCGEDATNEVKDEETESEEIVKIYFKGISVNGFGKLDSGFSGIGVVIIKGKYDDEEDSSCCVQKRLDFYVENWVADYLALIDGLGQVLKSDVTRVFGFTDSQIIYEQIMLEKSLDKPLMIAFRERILELVTRLESFTLKLVPSIQVQRPLQLAQVALGLVSLHEKNCGSLQNCAICCDDKPSSMMLTLCCSHKFCSHCLLTYADAKLEARQLPIRCPQPKCKYFISTSECKLFLPVISYNILEKALGELNVLRSEKMYCPHRNCSALIDPRQCLSDESSDSCVECPVCQRSICVNCGVPWHNSLSCGEYQDLPLEDRDASDVTLHRLALDRRWRRCQQCRRMIEHTQGCYHMTCWCGHEFCYACGAEYTANGQQTCECAFWDEGASSEESNDTITAEDQWEWNSFDTFPMIIDAYSDQERSQLALIQRFLAGGFSLSDHHPCQSPTTTTTPACTDSYVDVMKDLHQLPWLERFVSVISDNYDDEYTH